MVRFIENKKEEWKQKKIPFDDIKLNHIQHRVLTKFLKWDWGAVGEPLALHALWPHLGTKIDYDDLVVQTAQLDKYGLIKLREVKKGPFKGHHVVFTKRGREYANGLIQKPVEEDNNIATITELYRHPNLQANLNGNISEDNSKEISDLREAAQKTQMALPFIVGPTRKIVEELLESVFKVTKDQNTD